MAQAAADDSGKVLWLTLALSWVRLAEHVAGAGEVLRRADAGGEDGGIGSTDYARPKLSPDNYRRGGARCLHTDAPGR
jgi:hypothetical protein